MAATNYTPISLYYSTTASAVPTAGNLISGELAINITDGKLYYKNNSGVVTLIAGATAGPAGGSNNQVQYNSSGLLTGSANLTFNGTTLTANTIGAFILSGNITQTGNPSINIGSGALTAGASSLGGLTITGTGVINVPQTGSTQAINITANAASNAVLKLDATADNGYGAAVDYRSKTTGGVSNAWAVGTGVTGGSNAFEWYDGTAQRMRLDIGGGLTITGALSATLNSSTTTGIATNNNSSGTLARNGLLATGDAQNGFFGVNGSGYTGVSGWADAGIININSASNGMIIGLDGVTKLQVTSTGLAVTGSTRLTGGNGDQLYLDNTGQRYTQLHFQRSSVAKADIYWDNDTSTFNIRNIVGSEVAITGALSVTTTIKTGGYTVATLPAGTVGMRAYVTDATAPTYNGALTGGGAVTVPVFYNGAAWVSA